MRKSGVSDVSREDATRILARMSAICRACRARGLWRTTPHTNKRAALHRSRPPADQSRERLASWMGKLSDTPTSPQGFLQGCRACWRGCHGDAMRKLLWWNLSLSTVFAIVCVCLSMTSGSYTETVEWNELFFDTVTTLGLSYTVLRRNSCCIFNYFLVEPSQSLSFLTPWH